MEVILDTNFLLEMVKRKIDFADLEEFGELAISEQVLSELEKIIVGGERKDKEMASLALQIIEKNKEKFKIINLPKNFVDRGIVDYAEKNKVIIATIDKKLKRELRGKVRFLIIRGKRVEIS